MGIAVSTGMVVASVMAWVTDQRHQADLAKQQASFDHKLTVIQDQSSQQLHKVTETMTNTIEDLNRKISSIERKLPKTGPKYLDVSTLTIGPDDIRALGREFQHYQDGDFYEAAPASNGWAYSKTNGLAEANGGHASKPTSEYEQILADNELFLWRYKKGIEFFVLPSQESDYYHISAYPQIRVDRITPDYFKKVLALGMKMVGPILDAASSEINAEEVALNAREKRLARTLDNLHRDVNEAHTKAHPDRSKSGGTSPEPRSPVLAAGEKSSDAADDKLLNPALENVKLKNQILDTLGNAVNSDMASLLLFSMLEGNLISPMLDGATTRVLSAQKKGNVFYLQEEKRYKHAKVYSKSSFSETRDVIIDEELFFFGRAGGGYLVDISLPRDVDPTGFAYTQSWLLGFRVPLE